MALSSAQGAAAAERMELADMLHMRYAHQLFAAGDHDGAFAHFGMVSAASPLVLLRLFPSLAPRALLESVRPGARGAALASLEVDAVTYFATQRKPGPPCQCSCTVPMAISPLLVRLSSYFRAGHAAGHQALGPARTTAPDDWSGMLSLLRTVSMSCMS